MAIKGGEPEFYIIKLEFVNLEGLQNIQGLVVYNYDINYYNSTRIEILYLGFPTLEGFSIGMKELIDYIWSKCDGVDEIRIKVAHLLEENNMVNDEVKKTLIQNSFKWKHLVNDKEQGRSTVYGLKK